MVQLGTDPGSVLVITFTNKVSQLTPSMWGLLPAPESRPYHDKNRRRSSKRSSGSPMQPLRACSCGLPIFSQAADELKERLKGVLGAGLTRGLSTGTFHVACSRILRRAGEAIGGGKGRGGNVPDSQASGGAARGVRPGREGGGGHVSRLYPQAGPVLGQVCIST